MTRGKLNGRRARNGWRSEINGGHWWKIKEHKRIRQIEAREEEREVQEELAEIDRERLDWTQ